MVVRYPSGRREVRTCANLSGRAEVRHVLPGGYSTLLTLSSVPGEKPSTYLARSLNHSGCFNSTLHSRGKISKNIIKDVIFLCVWVCLMTIDTQSTLIIF